MEANQERHIEEFGLKRTHSGGILPPFPSSKRRNSITGDERSMMSMPWFSGGYFMHDNEMMGKSLDNGLMYSSKVNSFSDDNSTKRNGPYDMKPLWDLEGASSGIGISDANGDSDEPRCAICCEFVTQRSSHVCTCQIQSCSR